MMSVFTFFAFLAACLPLIVESAPNPSPDRLLNSIQAKFQSDQSVQSVFTATASPAAVSSYLSSIDALPPIPSADSSNSIFWGEYAAESAIQAQASETGAPLPYSTGGDGGSAPGSSMSVVPAASPVAVGSQKNQAAVQTAGTSGDSSPNPGPALPAATATNIDTVSLYPPVPQGTPIISLNPVPNPVSLYQIAGSFVSPSSVPSSTIQPPPPSSSGAVSQCTNGTNTQNMTADYSQVNPGSDFGPLFYYGLNYTTFFLTSYPEPNHLATAPDSDPKTIAVASPGLSFNLYTLELFCAYSSPIIGDCTIVIYGLGASVPGESSTANIQTITLVGAALDDLTFAENWRDLSQVTFSAHNGNVTVGVGIRAAAYAITNPC